MELKELLGKELYTQVQEKIGDKKLIVNDGSYVPREKLNEKLEEVKFLNSQYEQTLQKMQELQSATSNVEEVKEQLSQIKEQFEQEKTAWNETLLKTRLEGEIEKELIRTKARNPKAVKALLDMEAIKLENDKVLGLPEQLEELKNKEPYLFETGETVPNDKNRGSITPMEKNPYVKENFNLTAQIMLESDNPTLAAKLRKEALNR